MVISIPKKISLFPLCCGCISSVLFGCCKYGRLRWFSIHCCYYFYDNFRIIQNWWCLSCNDDRIRQSLKSNNTQIYSKISNNQKKKTAKNSLLCIRVLFEDFVLLFLLNCVEIMSGINFARFNKRKKKSFHFNYIRTFKTNQPKQKYNKNEYICIKCKLKTEKHAI